MPEQLWLGRGNKSEALGRRRGEAGHVFSTCSLFTAEQPLASSCQLRFPPRGRDLVFSWQSRGCWEGKAEPASFLVELEAWGMGAVVLWETGSPSLLPPEPETLRKGHLQGAA